MQVADLHPWIWTPKIGFDELVAEMVREIIKPAERDELIKKNGYPCRHCQERSDTAIQLVNLFALPCNLNLGTNPTDRHTHTAPAMTGKPTIAGLRSQ